MRRAAALLLGLCPLWPAAPAGAADRAQGDPGPGGDINGHDSDDDVYDHRALTSPSAVERYVVRHAGAGRPHGRP